MKKQLLTAVTAITVIFAGLTGCAGNNPTAKVSGENDTVQTTKEYVADLYADGTEGMTEIKEASVTEPEVVSDPEAQTEKGTAEGQTIPDETQADKNGGEGEEQQTKPQSTVKPSAPAQPETQAPAKAPASSTVKPSAPAQPETQAPAKVPAQPTVKPSTPAQPETQAPAKAPAQSTVKPSAPAQPETQAPAKAHAQPTVKPSAPEQPETQAPAKAEPPKEKTMWDAPYDVEAIKAYMVAELKARGYVDNTDYEAVKQDIWDEYNNELDYEEWKEWYLPAAPFGENLRAWDNFCTATAGPNRYYDNVNHCTVGHQHYSWSSPATGAGEKKNSEGLTSLEFMVNDAINYWDEIYGYKNNHGGFSGGGFHWFNIYVEEFSDGCVIFYILAL